MARVTEAPDLHTLLAMARSAERRSRPVECELVLGGLGNGRTETALSVSGMYQGKVVLTQGLTADQVFVGSRKAENVLVRWS